jgi:hypothetical protein
MVFIKNKLSLFVEPIMIISHLECGLPGLHGIRYLFLQYLCLFVSLYIISKKKFLIRP